MSEYERDILLWSEHQAALLRRVAAGERINDQIDWENVIEEIESVGRSEVKAVRSALLQALLHDLKAEAWPRSPYVDHWRAEAVRARGDAADDFTESMRAKIDLGTIYRRALRAMPATIDGQPPLPLPERCPVTLDELLNEE
ncbi:MAG: DUF29 domain-containing protein [Acetobacteraceae bacterium]|nr:DUF29 domain-containing protein [Acetobacteraceae bacterium]MBV8523690.1 DUF29 domain-containing protein [Acetobacteraceae bacterium]MBV8591683.1 DUF29 domain-containing protein [Acetobacteraceae bacterium]